jgi:hypothetical protein
MTNFDTNDRRSLRWDGSNWVPDVGGAGSGEINFCLNPNAVAAVDNSNTNDVGDWIAVGGGAAVERATTGLPRAPYQTSGINIALTVDEDYVRLRFRVPPADRGKKLKIEWAQEAPAPYTSGAYRVEIYNFSDAYSTGSQEIALHGDVSGDSLIPAQTGVYYNEFDADDREYYEMRIVGEAVVAGSITLNDVVIGPGKLHSGAVVTAWEAFTPTGSWTDNTTYTGFRRRVGENLECQVRVSLSGAPNSTTLDINLPPGLTINTNSQVASDTNGLVLGHGTIRNPGPKRTPLWAYYLSSTSMRLRYGLTSGTDLSVPDVTQAAPATFASADFITLDYKVPIAEWKNAGVLNVITQDNLTEWHSWTPTGSWTTNTTYTGMQKRVGDDYSARIQVALAGAPTSASLTINLPYTVDESKLPLTNTNLMYVGDVFVNDASGSDRFYGKATYTKGTTGSIAIRHLAQSADTVTTINRSVTSVTQAAPIGTLASGDYLTIEIRNLPVVPFAGSQSSLVGFSAATDTQMGLVKLSDDFVATATKPGLVSKQSSTVHNSTFTMNGSGGTTSSIGIVLSRVGDFVTAYIPNFTATSGTSSNAFVIDTNLPVGYRPSSAHRIVQGMSYNNGGADTNAARWNVATNGQLILFRDVAGSNYTNSSVCGISESANLTWYVGS